MKKPSLICLAFISMISGAHAAVNCTASITSPVTFPGVNPLTSSTYNTTSTLTIRCSGLGNNNPATVCPDLGVGSGGSNSSSQRLLSGPGGTLAFQIFSDSARSTPWGTVGSYGLTSVPLIQITGNGSVTVTETLYLRLYSTGSVTTPGTYLSSFTPAVRYGSILAPTNCASVTLPNTTGAPFVVQTTLASNCSLNVTQNVDFGSAINLTTSIDTTGALSVQCTNSTAYQIGLGPGNGPGATTSSRKMSGPSSATIGYALYGDSGRTRNWGNSVGIDTVGGIGTGSAIPATVYARIPAQATPANGAYTDSVVVTVTY